MYVRHVRRIVATVADAVPDALRPVLCSSRCCATVCSSTCPTGTELVEPCGISNDRVCVPKEHAACARKAVTLTVASLNSIMEDSCENCGSYVGHINTALKEGYMACPLRLSAFIAQARHATDGFKYLKSQASNGAGAIHLQPSNFRLACLQVPELKTAFVAAFGSCDISSSQHSAAANIVARPEYAFRVAVWWFRTGSSQLLGDPCGDLRFDADYGLGTSYACAGARGCDHRARLPC